jgi:hypothetical protein
MKSMATETLHLKHIENEAGKISYEGFLNWFKAQSLWEPNKGLDSCHHLPPQSIE